MAAKDPKAKLPPEGRRRLDLTETPDGSTPRFSLDGEFIPWEPRNTEGSSPERMEELRAAAIKVRELPHAVYRARTAIVAALKNEGYTRKEIADALGMKSVRSVEWCIRQARKENLLQDGMTEAIREMDQEAVPLAIDSIMQALRDNNIDVALKVASGRGLLRSYSNNRNDGPSGAAPPMAFQFNFVMPDGAPAPDSAAMAGKIVGTGKR